MASEKKVFKNDFKGGMDKDTQLESISPSDYTYALNVRQSSTGSGYVGEITNMLGNQLVQYILPAGVCKVIGVKNDETNNRFFYFIYNSLGYHTILQYNIISKYIEKVMQSITDATDGSDFLNFDPGSLILGAEIVDGNLLYWVDQGRNNARKANLIKVKDKSINGYQSLYSELLSAYKRAPSAAPRCAYVNDLTRQNNKLYRHLFKFAYQYVYDDAEQSTYSDFSTVPLPVNEPYNGSSAQVANTVTYSINQNNNGISVIVFSGGVNITQINIVAQIDGMNWVLVKNINKSISKILDNTMTQFTFFNDGSYAAIDPNLLIQPFSYLPANPTVQSLVNQRSMCYSGYLEGFDPYKLLVSSLVSYYSLDLSTSTVSTPGAPTIINNATPPNWRVNGSPFVTSWPVSIDFSTYGVVPGQTYSIKNLSNSNDNYYNYTAVSGDTPQTVCDILCNYWTREVSPAERWNVTRSLGNNVPKVTNNGAGIYSFVIYKSHARYDYPNVIATVSTVNYTSISGTNRTYKVNKSGSRVQYGMIYEDNEGRKTQVFTDPSWNVYSQAYTEIGSLQWASHGLTISHQPPAYAVRYQLVRTRNLTHASLIQFYSQAISIVTVNGRKDFVDVVLQGINSYHLVYPKNIIGYSFTPGDRMRFLFYPDPVTPNQLDTYVTTGNANNNFNEVEIVEQRFNTVYPINQTISTNGIGSTSLTVPLGSDISKVGMLITITNPTNSQFTRRVIAILDATHYTIDSAIGDTSTSNSFSFQDDRLILRVKNPVLPNQAPLTAAQFSQVSMVEVYTPSTETGSVGTLVYFEFGQKYDITNPGTSTAAHSGPVNQDGLNPVTSPAKFNIREGDTYVRLREMPNTNVYPGITSNIAPVEDFNFSDFYQSAVNDNGRPEAEAPYSKRSTFTQTIRNSQNFIPGTNINGMSLFMNTDRKDYTDTYGDIKRLFYKDARLYVFKSLRTGQSSVGRSIAYLADGTQQPYYTNALLEPILHYYAWRGGIGNNPESLAENGLDIYFCSANSGVALRLGGDGLTPISELYKMDSFFKPLLAKYAAFGGNIYGAFDRKNTEYVIAFENLANAIYNDIFSSSAWVVSTAISINPATFSIVTPPAHGSLSTIDNTGLVSYTPAAGYSGPDSFSYSVKTTGGISAQTVNQCLNVIAPNRPTAWRGSAPVCQQNGASQNTGYALYTSLVQYYIDTMTNGDPTTGTATGLTKSNLQSVSGVLNPDFIPPYYNLSICAPGVPITFTYTYDAQQSGATALLSGTTLTVPNNTSGTQSTNLTVNSGTAYSVIVTVPQAFAGSVSVNGTSQPVTPAASGSQALTFSYTGSTTNVVVTITAQTQAWRGRQSDSYCRKMTKVGATITGLATLGPFDIVVVNSLNRVFVSDYNSGGAGSVYVIDSNPANSATYNTIIQTIAVGNGPRCIVYVPGSGVGQGFLYVICQSSGSLYQINPSTYAAVSFATGVNGGLGLFYSTYQNCLFVPSISNGTMYKITLTGGVTSPINFNSLASPIPCYVNEDPNTGNLYISENNNSSSNNGPTRVFVVAPGGSTPFTTITLATNIGDTSYNMAFAPAQRNMYVPTATTKSIFVIDTNPANTATYNTVISILPLNSGGVSNYGGHCRYVATASSVYACSRVGSSIFQINPALSPPAIVGTGSTGSAPMAVDYASTGFLYTANYDAGTVTQIPYPNSFVNDSYQVFVTLEQYYSGSGALSGTTKPNATLDPNYTIPVVNSTKCPIGV